jgi:pimeloyl-ACP methyl ester carboxylesterase
MGAAVAELVAAGRPDRALGLTLVTPIPLAGTHLPDEMIDRFRSLGGDPEGERAVRSQLSAALPAAELDRLVATGQRLRSEVVRDLAECWNTGHLAGRQQSRFAGPVLIIRGEGDGFVTEDLVNAAVAPRFTAVEQVPVAKAGHWAHLEQSSEVAAHLDRFLARVLSPDGPPGLKAPREKGWASAFAQKSAAAFGEAFAADGAGGERPGPPGGGPGPGQECDGGGERDL